jgi:hypothetical protein
MANVADMGKWQMWLVWGNGKGSVHGEMANVADIGK